MAVDEKYSLKASADGQFSIQFQDDENGNFYATVGLFQGGTLSEQDKDAVMKALQDIYWESKARNVEKYTPKKYKKTGTDAEE